MTKLVYYVQLNSYFTATKVLFFSFFLSILLAGLTLDKDVWVLKTGRDYEGEADQYSGATTHILVSAY